MDLIYADQNGTEVGVIKFYDFDLAFGRDENSFDLTLSLNEHCCDMGYFLYIDNTEYGGIIDKIEVDTENKEVKYSGRTWHGILASKIIEQEQVKPLFENNYQYDANIMIGFLIQAVDLSDLFFANKKDSGINIPVWKYTPKTNDAYTELKRMLDSVGAKLVFTHIKNKIELKAELSIGYVNDDYFDSDTLNFVASKSNNVPNHIICVLENNEEKKKIHIFTDENGVVQPYIKNSSALDDDSRYYLDKSQQVLFGKDEIVELKTSGINVREIYHPITSIPLDWVSNFENYYHIENSNGEDVTYAQNQYVETPYYIKVSSEPEGWESNWSEYYVYNELNNEYTPATAVNNNIYSLINTKPEQWEEEFESYYVKNGEVYDSVQGIDDDSLYELLDVVPPDWSTNYGNYFEKDFAHNTFVPAQSTESESDFSLLPARPTDWENNISSYYYKAKKYKQINVGGQITAIEDGSGWLQADKYYARDGSGIKTFSSVPNYEQNKYYEVIQKAVPPFFVVGRFYSKSGNAVAPEWQTNTYYVQSTTEAPPTFVANKFYKQRINKFAKVWLSGQYFRLQSDHYIEAIEDVIEDLKNKWNTRDNLEIELPTLYNYDIGDIVGATEHITNLEVRQYVTKKIVKIKNGKISIDYEIGKEK